MKPGAVAASRSGSTVAFSWEQEPGVSKQIHAEAKEPTTAGAPLAEAVSGRAAPPSAKKQAPAPPAAVTAHPRRLLRVPPPPGGPGAPAVSPAGKSKPRSRGVRPADDPFLAAYLACTEGGSNGGRDDYRGTQRLLGWAGLGLGLGLGLSCKSSCGAVEECVVRLAKISRPGLDED